MCSGQNSCKKYMGGRGGRVGVDGGAVIVHLTAEISHAAEDGILFYHKVK